MLKYSKMSFVRFHDEEFKIEVVSNSGMHNNCLGFALGNFLKCSPGELRESFKRMVIKNHDNTDLLTDIKMCMINDNEDFDKSDSYWFIMNHLNANCFIPVDLFLIWCHKSDDKSRLLLNCNIVFFVKRENNFYEPVIHYFENTFFSTCYIGCHHYHYEQLLMQKRNAVFFDLLYFDSATPNKKRKSNCDVACRN